jgi:mannose-6-phosphate isomerase-like protein (cupin superfamily)
VETHKHEDDRRILIEWVRDYPVRFCKAIIIKSGNEIGNHYHLEKEEIFYLLKGNGTVTLDGHTRDFKEGDCIFIPKAQNHSFNLKRGSIILGAATKPYNPKDTHELH